jgi:hypothetical protein
MRNWLRSRLSRAAGKKTWSETLGLSCLVGVILLLCAVSAVAQLSGKGQITGVVTDKTGAVIPNAEVTVQNTATSVKTVNKTNNAGSYTFSALDPGIYSLMVKAQGFQTLLQENIHVNAMESQPYNPSLAVASASTEEITVTAEPPQLETSNATLGNTMEQETYSELPVMMGAYGQADQRRATDFVYLMPGVQGNNTTGNATTNVGIINGSGSKGAASAVYIDGIPFVRAGGNGDPRYVWSAISVDAIDQFQVQTTGYSAIYEGQGVMNYSVKGGGPKYHGTAYEFFRNTALDTWGFWGKAVNTAVGHAVKPVEHNNEYGVSISGPLVPFGGLKNKLFFFENYNGYRYSSAVPTAMTFPTAAQQSGDFSTFGLPIYDPTTQAVCTSTTGTTTYKYNCRTQYSYNGQANVISPGKISAIATKMQSALPSGIGSALQYNYIGTNATGLNNWSTTSRVDYVISPKDTLSVIGAVGRQASSSPVGQSTPGRNIGPAPYNYGQAYAPKTAVWSLEETHVFSQNVLNQLKWGYARYNGPTFSTSYDSKYSANTMGISGLPSGQAAGAFPIVKFSGTNVPTQWGGTTANVVIAQNYTVLDNLQWNVGKHSITFGGQIAWLLYNTTSATGGTTPLTLNYTNTETGQFSVKNTTSATNYTIDTATGAAYASFLVGQADSASLTDYTYHPTYGARFRAISPYVQDDWKVSSKLTVNLGLRYDFFPTAREVNDMASFFNPNLASSATGMNGALQFAGFGTNTCNCHSPVNNYFKNFGPRLGLAYQLDSKTVIRGSYGLMFTHGDAVGGNTYSLGTQGFSASGSWTSSNAQTTLTNLTTGGTGVMPTYAAASGAASGNALGSGYLSSTYATNGGITTSPTSANYLDPYLGGRAPEYLNWSFGAQRQLTNAIALNVTYVGSQGHFLQMDGSNARGYWANQLDPKYLYLGSVLSDSKATVATDCTKYSLNCQGLKYYNTTTSNFSVATALKPFPFNSVSDAYGYVANSNYNALQAVVNIRNYHGLTTTVSYTLSRSIDNGGNFRSGYTIPTDYIQDATGGSFVSNQRYERTVSTSNQPQHLTVTAVWRLPLGKSILASSRLERALLGGYTLSGVVQAYSGSPLAVTLSTCNTNPAQGSWCPASYNASFTGKARINGKWGKGVTTGTANSKAFIDSTAFVKTSDYKFGNLPRTAPYNLYGPGNYQADLSLSRSFPLHFIEGGKFDFKAQWYNITNHTQFAVASTALGSSTFGMVTTNGAANRKAAQFTARISF